MNAFQKAVFPLFLLLSKFLGKFEIAVKKSGPIDTRPLIVFILH